MLQSLKNIFVFTQGLTWLVFKKDFNVVGSAISLA